MKKGTDHIDLCLSHALNRLRIGYLLVECEGPTSVGQPALGLEPAPTLNDNTNI